MDDEAIVISDDEPSTNSNFNHQKVPEDDECIFIEESTIVEERCEASSSTFSFAKLVSKTVKSSISNEKSGKSFHSEMEELEKLIAMKRNSESLESQSTIDIDDEVAVIGRSDGVIRSKPEKRKLINDEREKSKEARENAKKAKDEERDRKKCEAQKKKEEKENEKEMRKIEREMSASINSKCELYTYCHIGKKVFEQYPGLEAETRMLYSDRKIENQLKIEYEMGTRIEWRRKCVELREDDNGKHERFEYSSTQDLFAVVVPSETLKDVILSNSLEDFIVEQRSSVKTGRSTMITVAFGKLDLPKKKLHQLSIEIYEKYRAQIVQIDKISELALFTAQYLRSLARREKKRIDFQREDSSDSTSGGHKIQYHGDKGITIGSRDEVVSDWWNKMLSTIDRLSDAQRRAVIKKIPDPIAAIDKFKKMDYSEAIREIGELVAENGRRVGPVMAHRIYTMLNDETGTAIVE